MDNDLIKEIRKWFRECSEPNDRRRYNRCPVCNGVWWGEEKHERDCWMLKLGEKDEHT
jgi:hypothetical protein